jgi:hypothetical protein
MLIRDKLLVNISKNYNAVFDVFRADTPALRVENAFEDPKLHLDGREIRDAEGVRSPELDHARK